jgi:hypothetical protein
VLGTVNCVSMARWGLGSRLFCRAIGQTARRAVVRLCRAVRGRAELCGELCGLDAFGQFEAELPWNFAWGRLDVSWLPVQT